MQNRGQDSKRWAEIYLAVFLAGIALCFVGRPKRSDCAEKNHSAVEGESPSA
jgi:hypothetical protein